MACVRMGAETLSHPSVVEHVKQGFVAVKVDFLAQADLGKRYGVQGVPSTVVLDAAGGKLAQIDGNFKPEVYVRELTEIVDDDRRFRAGKAALEKDPEDARAAFEVGRVHRLRGEHDAALPLIEKALERDPQNALGFAAEAHWHISWSLLNAGNLKGAQHHNDRIALLDPEDKLGYRDDARFLTCELLVRKKDWATAEVELSGLLKEFPDSDYAAHALVYHGMTWLKLKDKAKALAAFKAAATRFPDSPWGIYSARTMIPQLEK